MARTSKAGKSSRTKVVSTSRTKYTEQSLADTLADFIKSHGTARSAILLLRHQDGFLHRLTLSQAELRIAAELSRDLELVSCFRAGGQDVHWRTLLYMVGSGRSREYLETAIKTARELAGVKQINLTDAMEILGEAGHTKAIEKWKGWKEARKKAKAINFGFVFGMYENKFIQQAKTKYDWDCTYEEAHAFREAYFELYRGIPPWHEKQKALVRADGSVRNLFGRLRRLPGIHSSDKELRMECERQAINSPVQGRLETGRLRRWSRSRLQYPGVSLGSSGSTTTLS